MPIRKLLRRAARMCRKAYLVQKLSLIWAGILLTGALLLFEGALPLSPHTYAAFRLAEELMRTASAVLLVGVVGAVCIEERQL
jgi:hypothetical protein